MVKVIRRDRQPPILTPSAIPCLHRLPTLNVTEGCCLGCTYCYIQGYTHYPGKDTIVLFANTAEILREELSRKRKRTRRVYFSPSSDAFQYIPEVQEVSFQAMSVLLEHGVEVSFLTKGFVTDRFLALFSAHREAVFAQIGISTLDKSVWRCFEPRTAPPTQRLQTIRRLREIGIATTARLDPLIPDLTDTEARLSQVLDGLRDVGITSAAASFLFTRPAFAKSLSDQISAWRLPTANSVEWEYQEFRGGNGGGRMIGPAERRRRFERLAALAKRFRIAIRPCRCKNPEFGAGDCHIAGPAEQPDSEGVIQPLLQFPVDVGRGKGDGEAGHVESV